MTMKQRGATIKRNQKNNGFTIVELLIVVVVIAILAAITMVAYNGIQTKAKASVISSGIKTIEKSLLLAAQEDGLTTWWYDTDYRDANDESTLQVLIDGTVLKKYLKSSPSVVGEDASFWEWDNDGDEVSDEYDPTVCPPQPGTQSGGVNIKLQLTQQTAQEIDTSLDDGNLQCGIFRIDEDDEVSSGSGAIYLYLISRSSTIGS